MTKFSDGIIRKIKQEHIAPVPRWHFLLKNYSLWTAFIVSVMLGSLSFSVIAHRILYGDWEVIEVAGLNPVLFFFVLLPYIWLLFLGLFSILAYFEWRHTKNAYRFRTYYMIVGSIAVSAVLGSFFYRLGLGKRIDVAMMKVMPYYNESLHKQRNDIWLRPDKGLLTGEVESVDDTGIMTIRDGSGKEWTVVGNAATVTQIKSKPQRSASATEIQVNNTVEQKKMGVEVVVIAERGQQGEFIAKKIKVVDEDHDDEDDKEDDDKASQSKY